MKTTQSRLNAVLSLGSLATGTDTDGLTNMINDTSIDDTLTIFFDVKCSKNSDAVGSIEIDQRTVDKSSSRDVVVFPGTVSITMNYEFGDEHRLHRRLEFVSGSASEGDKNYEVRIVKTGVYRDGGSTTYKLDVNNPINGKWYPLKLTAGEKYTHLTFEFK